MPPLIEQSFMKALFHGVIAEDMIFPYPEMPAADRENTSMILDGVRRFCARSVDSARIDREERIGREVLEGLKALGLFGLVIPTEYDGIGLSASAYARVMQEVGALDGAIAATLGAHQSIGLKGILLFGTPEQKRRYLPRLATGEHTAAFALTEPSAGSDAAAIKTRAEKSADGSHYLLNGSKIWITNGGFADVFTVFARTSALQEGSKPRITAFIVERAMGVTSGPEEKKLGVRGASTTEIFLHDVKVPVENVLGEVGRGFRVAMEVLNSGRLGLAAGCVGLSSLLVRMAIDRGKERRAFGRNIGEFGLIKDKIATMLAETYALESMTYLTAGIVDNKVADYSLESAICKITGSETVWRVANEAAQIAAGTAYMADFPYERLLRDARVNLIFEGTNEILRCFVALSGLAGPGKALADVGKAMREPIKGFGLLSDFAVRKARTVLGRERMTRAHPLLTREAVIFEELTGELAAAAENVLRKHGREIAEMQYTQKRIADMAIDLYALAACLSRTTRAIERRGEDGARREIDLTSIFTTAAQKRLRQNVFDFTRNDDELRKAVASRSYADGAYPFDVL
jgi:acyl-CoA dehydrogenase family protein 9